MPSRIRLNKICLQPGSREIYGQNLLASSYCRYRRYTQIILPLHNSVPFLPNSFPPNKPSWPNSPAYVLPYSTHLTDGGLANATRVATFPKTECDSDGLHYPAQKITHPTYMMLSSPDGSSTVRSQSHCAGPTTPNSNNATSSQIMEASNERKLDVSKSDDSPQDSQLTRNRASSTMTPISGKGTYRKFSLHLLNARPMLRKI